MAELGSCIPAETVKACALIGLHTMAEENALRTVTLLLSWEICESMAARKALLGAAVVVTGQEVRARLLLRITSTTSITSLLKPFSQHGRAVTFEERDVLGEMEWQWTVWMSWPVWSWFLLQFEHGVPSSEWGCSFYSFVCLLVFVYSSEYRKEALSPFGSFVATNRRMVFLTFDVHVGKKHRNCLWCAPFIYWSVRLALVTVFFFLSHKAPTQKPLKIKKTEWLPRNDEVWEWWMSTDGETVVILHIVRLKRMCRKLSWCHRFSTLPCVMQRQLRPNYKYVQKLWKFCEMQ